MLRGPELSTELVAGGGSDDEMQTYSEKFKRKMVQRMSGVHPMSATALSKEVGVPQATLSRWLLGSTSEAVLSGSPASVLLVPVDKAAT